MDKTSLKNALLEAKEIESAAYNSAKKFLEESISPKIEEVVNETIKELEKNSLLKEDVKIDVDSDGAVSVTKEEEKEIEPLTHNSNTNMEIENKPETTEEMFEVVNEDGTEAPVSTDAPVATDAPAEAPAAEEVPAEGGIEELNQKMTSIESKLDSIINTMPSLENSDPSAEGEVEIVDDENPAGEMPVSGAKAPAEVPSELPATEEGIDEMVYEIEEEGVNDMEEVVYEIEEELEEEMVYEVDMTENNLEEIEIVDEMTGVSASVQHREPNRLHKPKDGHHAPVAPLMKENTDQNVSKIDDLKKENASLKETIKEYKDSFIVLRKQINEVQIFNAKLAYANKLFTNGGLTNSEKVQIAEEFDKVETIEEAKILYNKLITESNVSKTSKTSVEKVKSIKPESVNNSAAPSQTQTLYEGVEMKRMRELAGIIK